MKLFCFFTALIIGLFSLANLVYSKEGVPERDYRIAVVLFNEAEYEAAEAKFSKVIEDGDVSIPEAAAYVVNSYYGRASCKIEQGRKLKEDGKLDSALDKYDQAFVDLSLFKNKFEELQDKLRSDTLYDEMEKHFMTISDQMVQLAGEAGDISAKQGKYDRAIDWYDKGLRYIDSGASIYGDILYAKADAVFQLGDYEETLRLLDRFKDDLSRHKLAGNAMFYVGDIHRTIAEMSTDEEVKEMHIKDACDAYKQVILSSPTGANVELVKMALLEKGRCEKKLGNMDAALADFEEIKTYYPDTQYYVDATLEIGDYFFLAKDYSSALDNFDRAMKGAKSLDLLDRMAIAYYWIGWSHFRDSSRIDVEASPEMARRAKNLYEQSSDAFQNCVRNAQKFWDKQGKDTQMARELEGYYAESLFMVGRCNQGLQKWDDAIKAFGQIPQTYKEWWFEGLAEIAISYERKGDSNASMAKWDELKRELSRARMPNIELRLLMARAEGVFDLQRYPEAEEAYREILTKYPDSSEEPQARVSLGLSLFKQGKSLEAIQEFSVLLSKYGREEGLDTIISEGLFWKGYLLARSAADETATANLNQALRDYRELISRFPDNPRADDAQFEIGFITYSLGSNNQSKYSEAITEYSKVAQNYPNSEYSDDAVYEIARCYQLLGDKGKEEDYLKQMVQTYPNSELADNALLRIAEIYFERMNSSTRTGERQNTESTYNQIILKYPNTESEAVAHFQLGSIFFKFDGNFHGAMTEFASCVNIVDKLLGDVMAGAPVPSDLDVATISNLVMRANFWQAESMFRIAKQAEDRAEPAESVKRAYAQARDIYRQLLNREARLKSDFPEKARDLHQIMEGEKLDIPIITETHYMIARCLYKEGNLQDAKANAQLITSPEKIRFKAELLMASIAYDSGELNEAQSILDKWRDSPVLREMADEFNAEIQTLTAKIAWRSGNISEAKALALDAWALFQSFNGLWEESAYIVAKCYQQQNDMEKAKSWFEKLEKSPIERWRVSALDAMANLNR